MPNTTHPTSKYLHSLTPQKMKHPPKGSMFFLRDFVNELYGSWFCKFLLIGDIAVYNYLMPRTPLIRTDLFPYHVTARVNNKESFYLRKQEVWSIFAKVLRQVYKDEAAKVHSFVLMDNHFHLLITTPNENLDKIMYWVMKNVTLQIQRKTGRINRVFGGRYKWSLVSDESYLYNVYKYLALNPVRAGISKSVQSYNYSTFKYMYLRKSPGFNINPIFEKYRYLEEQTWKWFNEKFEDEELYCLQSGLRRSSFKYKKGIDKKTIHCSHVPFL
jgi:putative transposase